MKKRRRREPKLENTTDQSPTSTSDYSFSLTKIAVSQICRSIGYKSTDSSALNTLTLTATKFLQSLAGLASSFSNRANRTEVNLFDIINALQNIALSTPDCFPGASIESHCLINSAFLRNLSDFVTHSPEIPFAKPLPRPERDLAQAPVTRSIEVKYIPPWLPPFPDSSLYSQQCTKDRSDHLWENSGSVEILQESCNGRRSGGKLPQRRDIVRFKIGKDCNNGASDTRLERWRENKDGESGFELVVKKKIIKEYIYSPDEWNF